MAGDPAPDGSVVWTRVLAPPDGGGVPVLWTVADDDTFATIRAGGMVVATADRGHCVSVPVTGLDPDRWYAYRFEVDGVPSRAGRLRTAPAPGSSPDHLRFAFASCQQLNASWFVAHQAIAAEPGVDFLVHLGDYVYVSDTATQSLDDYRSVYRRWRERPELRDLHAALPTVGMWDDGEFYNGNDRFGPPRRLANATRAWFEAFPYLDAGDHENHRVVRWGDLADLPVIDVRTHRDPYLDTIDLTQGEGLEAYDPARSTLGAQQFAWLCDLLGSSTAAWRLVAQGYPIHPWRLLNLELLRPFRPDLPPNAGLYVPSDGWDHFMVERRDLLRYLADHGVSDTVFCSGQTHIFMASALRPDPDDPHSPVVGFDFVNGSLTADPDPRQAYLGDLPVDLADEVLHLAERWVLSQNSPNLRYMNLIDQGYTLVDVTTEEITVTFRMIDTFDPAAEAFDGATFRLARGATSLAHVPGRGQHGSFA
jgi:alkaline phosphatase D